MLTSRTAVRRLMYIERKSQAGGGRARIGWVDHLRSCGVYHYRDAVLRIAATGRYNCYDTASGEPCIVTAPKRNGRDRPHGGEIEIDEDARESYWLEVRKRPECVTHTSFGDPQPSDETATS